jgi:hypothetical protein
MTVERGSALVLRGDDPLDRRQIALAKRIVLLAKETFLPRLQLNRIDPIVHYAPADERGHRLIPCHP